MITLITGVPGTGKTALAVSMLLDFIKAGRPVFQHGIRDLTLPVVAVVCDSKDCEFCAAGVRGSNKLDNFSDWAPANAVILLDEVQRQFRVRGRASPVPRFVADLETHRHLGVDLVLLTQDPRLIDQNIRRLVTMHHHLEPGFLGSEKITWMECRDDPKKGGGGGVRSKWSPPKVAFQHYKSAELHTKVKKPIPKALFLVGFALVLGVVGGFFAVSAIKDRVNRVAGSVAPAAELGSAFEAVTEVAPVPVSEIASSPVVQDNGDTFDFEPTIPGVLESAPAYAGMVSYRDHPRRAACLMSGPRCRCYSQQGTDYPTTLQQCKAFIENRVSSFNPYASPAPLVASRSAAFEVPPDAGSR